MIARNATFSGRGTCDACTSVVDAVLALTADMILREAKSVIAPRMIWSLIAMMASYEYRQYATKSPA